MDWDDLVLMIWMRWGSIIRELNVLQLGMSRPIDFGHISTDQPRLLAMSPKQILGAELIEGPGLDERMGNLALLFTAQRMTLKYLAGGNAGAYHRVFTAACGAFTNVEGGQAVAASNDLCVAKDFPLLMLDDQYGNAAALISDQVNMMSALVYQVVMEHKKLVGDLGVDTTVQEQEFTKVYVFVRDGQSSDGGALYSQVEVQAIGAVYVIAEKYTSTDAGLMQEILKLPGDQ